MEERIEERIENIDSADSIKEILRFIFEYYVKNRKFLKMVNLIQSQQQPALLFQQYL